MVLLCPEDKCSLEGNLLTQHKRGDFNEGSEESSLATIKMRFRDNYKPAYNIPFEKANDTTSNSCVGMPIWSIACDGAYRMLMKTLRAQSFSIEFIAVPSFSLSAEANDGTFQRVCDAPNY